MNNKNDRNFDNMMFAAEAEKQQVLASVYRWTLQELEAAFYAAVEAAEDAGFDADDVMEYIHDILG